MSPIDIAETIGIIIAAASVIATATPNKTDDKILQKILDVINIVGMNVGKSKNKD